METVSGGRSLHCDHLKRRKRPCHSPNYQRNLYVRSVSIRNVLLFRNTKILHIVYEKLLEPSGLTQSVTGGMRRWSRSLINSASLFSRTRVSMGISTCKSPFPFQVHPNKMHWFPSHDLCFEPFTYSTQGCNNLVSRVDICKACHTLK